MKKKIVGCNLINQHKYWKVFKLISIKGFLAYCFVKSLFKWALHFVTSIVTPSAPRVAILADYDKLIGFLILFSYVMQIYEWYVLIRLEIQVMRPISANDSLFFVTDVTKDGRKWKRRVTSDNKNRETYL